MVEAAEPFMPPTLVSPAAIARMASLVTTLPPMPVLFFECRLETEEADADLAFCATAGSPGLEALAGRHAALAVAPALQRRAAWEGLRTFADEMMTPGLAAHDAVANLWMEFDRTTGESLPDPGVFVTFAPGIDPLP